MNPFLTAIHQAIEKHTNPKQKQEPKQQLKKTVGKALVSNMRK